MNQATTEQLNGLIREKFQALDRIKTVEILPSHLADEVLREIDPGSISPDLVGLAAVLELRQLARIICAKRHREMEAKSEQGSLFELQLQPRYPAERAGPGGGPEDAYVLRAHLTVDERWKNINRLYREANAKTAHADALKAETELLIRDGKLQEARTVDA